MTIQVQIKNIYGKETIYPICDTAKLFAQLAKQLTLTRRDCETIKAIGYRIEVVQDVKTI